MTAGSAGPQQVRATQKLVDQMGWVFGRPTLTLLEIAWRWLFGLPLILVCWQQARLILTALPPESAGLNDLDKQNPWIAVVQLADAWEKYQPPVAHLMAWLLPLAALAWIVISGVGRNVVMRRLEPGVSFRPIAMITLQAGWLAVLGIVFCSWFRCLEWVAATHIRVDGEADLVGYSIWVIFLSLGFFTVWALVSWPFAAAPTLMLLEHKSAVSALATSFRLGRPFTGKLMEVNLVMGIAKLALIVLAMVFSAAPLPFSDELGPDAMHVVLAGATLFYLAASDFFHVVRLKSYVDFWKVFRG
ncbi:MAG TPA: hypothetical protein VHZ28_06025 [Terracidiphilus sp.]|nr:hypothetical protein [Terracidiphilus sp.]